MALQKRRGRKLFKRGFTLLELLVVIAIIGLLSSIIVISVNSARAKARDAIRLADLRQMQEALEMYFLDNGNYPNIHAFTTGTSCGSSWCALETALAPYIKSLPRDPLSSQAFYGFAYDGGEADDYPGYGIKFRVEGSAMAGMAANDGGCLPDHYEIGPEPAYDSQMGICWWND